MVKTHEHDNQKPAAAHRTKTLKRTRQKSKVADMKNINGMLRFAFLQSFISIDFEQILINSPSGFALLLGNSHYKDMMIMFLNKYRQNLLHVTCRLNRSDFVEPLIKLGCNPAKQDYDGRTPFHVAMDYDHMECIDIFIRVMNETENEDRKFPDTVGEITAGLKCMFKPYNHIGFTIIHQTVHKDKPLVLEHLLRFCLKHNINVLESEVLGCGDSLLHLAVKKRGYKAAKIIVELYPESVKVRNYAGILAYDLDGVVEDMRKLLKLQSR